MMKKRSIWLILLLSLVTTYSFGQTSRPGDNDPNRPPANNHLKIKQKMIEQAQRNSRRNRSSNQTSDNFFDNTTVRYESRPNLSPLTKEQKEKISPSKEDLNKYESFLKGKNTGITKILPESACSDKLVLDINDKKCLIVSQIPGGGAYFYFSFSLHSHKSVADIHYVNNSFKVGFNNRRIGLISDMGDVPIETINSKNPEVKRLRNYRVPKSVKKLEKVKKLLEKGIRIGNFEYFNQTPIKLNTTYMFRTVQYQWSGNNWARDGILAIRVIRINPENEVTFLWKVLKNKPSAFLRNE